MTTNEMSASRRIPSFTMRAFWDELATRGISLRELELRSGVACPKHGDVLSTISVADSRRVYEAAAALTHDPTIGLSIAEAIGLRGFHIIGHIALASSTTRQALEIVRRVEPRIGAELPILEEVEGDRMRMGNKAIDPFDEIGAQIEAQIRVSLLYDRALHFVRRQPSLITVQLPFSEPANSDVYLRAFPGGVEFDADGTFVVFPRDGWYRPQSGSDPGLLKRLIQLAQEQYGVANAQQPWSTRVRQYLQGHDSPRSVDAAGLAGALAVSTRSLSRRLAEENVQLSTLMDEVLYERSRALLRRPNTTTADVAAALGYAELSSFFRAFRRWSGGLTPTEFRRQTVVE